MARPLPSREKQNPTTPDGRPVMNLKDWFVMPDAELVPRRHQVFALLHWYHERYVKPQIGFAGAFRRLWWQLTGHQEKLLDPWETIELKVQLAHMKRAAAARRAGATPEPSPDVDEAVE